MRKLLGFSLLLLLSGCSSPRPLLEHGQPIHAKEPAPTTSAQDIEDEKVISQWQEQRHKHFFDWPVDDAIMSRGYLPNRKRPHLGIDLAAPKNTKIYSAHDGLVIYAGRDFRGFGKMVMIEGAKGWATLYAHFATIKVKEGQRVRQGEVIGLMGRTGRASGVHLHFEIRKSKGPVDPLLYLPGGTRVAETQ